LSDQSLSQKSSQAPEHEETTSTSSHSMPFGAEIQSDRQTRFRFFAPSSDHVHLDVEGIVEPIPMQRDDAGWHELVTPAAAPGSLYRFALSDGTHVPDPASRYQPHDVHGPSEVMDPGSYRWHDRGWRGRPWSEAILYELHVGTFTSEGTFRSAIGKLDHLAELGITAIELMCLSDFAGNRNWGYDGVLLYAPDSAYGPPDALKAFIDAAHAKGIMIILDVVYNHFGPEGNFINNYFPQICSDNHDTPWGKSLNFDGEHSDVVRGFIIHNALYWVEEFHVDGLRFDASHAMVDESPRHILDELHDRVEALACGRPIHLILENEQNIVEKLNRDSEGKPTCYTAQWNHDITHLLSAVFSDICDPGKDQQETGKLAKALAEGFMIAAQMEGKGECTVPPTAFVSFIQTHDLVGNRIFGERIFADVPPETIRAIASIYLLLPQIPMLFMGEEWGASTPFPFFCDYHGELADAVKKGRYDQLMKLDPAPSQEEMERAPDPQAESTLRDAQLKWEELEEGEHAQWFDLYKRLIHVRLQSICPLLAGLARSCGSSTVIAPGALTAEWTLHGGVKLHLAANLCKQPRSGFPLAQGQELWMQGSQQGVDTLDAWSVRWTLEGEATLQ
jgi:malto-oligosyltrehalose trehalohydrolase